MVNEGLKEGLMILSISRKMAKISTVSRKMAKISTVSRESHHSIKPLLNEKKHRLALLNSVDRPEKESFIKDSLFDLFFYLLLSQILQFKTLNKL